MKTPRWNRLRLAKLLPVLLMCYGLGCLPDGSVGQVLGENMLLTSAVVIQSITSMIFNGLFGLT